VNAFQSSPISLGDAPYEGVALHVGDDDAVGKFLVLVRHERLRELQQSKPIERIKLQRFGRLPTREHVNADDATIGTERRDERAELVAIRREIRRRRAHELKHLNPRRKRYERQPSPLYLEFGTNVP
jgi:hypothetical protein